MNPLADIPVKRIVRAIADAAERWSDADFPPRVRATDRIADRTGYSIPVVEYALDRLFFSITRDALEAAIRNELGSEQILDGFVPRASGPDAWAAPLGEVCLISSRTTIGVALIPAIFALCAKNRVLVKDREDSLVAAFFDTLTQEDEAFEDSARALAWSAEDPGAQSLDEFDAVVVFGTDRTLQAVRNSLRAGARFIGYGRRASAGYVTRESLGDGAHVDALAQGAARDLVLYESEGCLSLHVLFVERGGDTPPAEFAKILAAHVERAAIEFPLGTRSARQAAGIAQFRDLAAFRAAAGTGAVFSDARARYAVSADHPAADPPPFLPRTLGIVEVDAPDDALHYLRRHALPLEGFALSGTRSDAVRAALRSGAVRLTRFGELQHPPLGGNHGGRPRIAEFVRWIDRTL